LPVLGYNLYADSGRFDSFRLVYNGINHPQVTWFNFNSTSNNNETVDYLKTYRFKLEALNFNGAS